jgi:hypothetical protein
LPPGKLGALDFLAISGCEVQVTIGKRNSSLGRMAKESQRLLLELEYLALAPECIDYQRRQGRSGVADTLEQAWQLSNCRPWHSTQPWAARSTGTSGAGAASKPPTPRPPVAA